MIPRSVNLNGYDGCMSKETEAGEMVSTGAGKEAGGPQPPSRRQRETLDFIRRYMREHGVAPSRTEIAQALGVKHRSTADVYLTALMRKGWIELRAHQARYIRLLHDDVPVVRAGPVTAQEHVLAQARVIERVPQSVAERFDPTPDFFIKIQDDTMRGAGLVAGDIVAVQVARGVPRTGDIVVARHKGEITVRRLWRIAQRRISLAPEGAVDPEWAQGVEVDRDEVQIEGIMIGALIGRRPVPESLRDRVQ